MNRAQTATEYLIILAVVIIISVIVVSTLGGATFLFSASSTDKLTNLNAFSNYAQITHFELGYFYGVIELQNTHTQPIEINALTIGETECESSSLPLVLLVGKSKMIVCYGTYEPESEFSKYLQLNITEKTTQANYVINSTKSITGVSPISQEVKIVVLEANKDHYFTVEDGNLVNGNISDMFGWTLVEDNSYVLEFGTTIPLCNQNADNSHIYVGGTFYSASNFSNTFAHSLDDWFIIRAPASESISIVTGESFKFWGSSEQNGDRSTGWCT